MGRATGATTTFRACFLPRRTEIPPRVCRNESALRVILTRFGSDRRPRRVRPPKADRGKARPRLPNGPGRMRAVPARTPDGAGSRLNPSRSPSGWLRLPPPPSGPPGWNGTGEASGARLQSAQAERFRTVQPGQRPASAPEPEPVEAGTTPLLRRSLPDEGNRTLPSFD